MSTPIEKVVSEWTDKGNREKISSLLDSWPKLGFALGELASIASRGSSVAGRAWVIPMPPSAPDWGPRSDSAARSGASGTPASSVTDDVATAKQESLLDRCPACYSNDPAFKRPIGTVSGKFLKICNDDWHIVASAPESHNTAEASYIDESGQDGR